MNSREKLLVIGVGALAVLWAATMGVNGFRDARESNYKNLKKVREELRLAQKADEQGRKAQRKIRDWAKQSLPTDLDVAKADYEDWLREQLAETGLNVSNLEDKSSGGGNKRSREIRFVVTAGGSLEQLTDFLYRFYLAGHLHRISEATLKPAKGSEGLSISLTIDALSLKDCKRTNSLADRPSDLQLAPLEEIRQAIVSRNIFAVYKPGILEDPNGPTAAELDAVLAQARFTGMTYGQGGWQMAVRMEDSGKVLFFREGDPIEIGRFAGQVVELSGRQAIMTFKDQRVSVRLGQYLSQAQPLADQAG